MRHFWIILIALCWTVALKASPLSANEQSLKSAGEALASAAPAQRIVSLPSGRCLDVERASHEPATPVILYDCHEGTNQRWAYTSDQELRSLDGTMCLDVAQASTDPRSLVQSYSCNGGANQKWLV